MIHSLKLQNFQSHKQSNLEFDPGVNVIIGPSDSGKTSFIRALRWLVWNRPSGDAFRSTWGGSTHVIVKIDQDEITRLKNNTEQGYILRTGDEVKTHFKAIGTDVPEEIIQALNLNEINLQSQMDSPFLLSNSPGEVAKHFNRVAHLDQIDEGLSKVQKWIRAIEQDISSDDKQLIQLTEDLIKFEHLEKFEVDVEVLEGMESQMIQQINSKRVLDKLCVDLNVVKGLIEEQGKITEAGPLVDSILDLYEERQVTEYRSEALDGVLFQVEEIEKELEKESKIIGAEKEVNKLLSLFQDKTEERDNRSLLQKLIERILYITEEQITAENRSKRLQTEFNAVFPDVCPLCGKPK